MKELLFRPVWYRIIYFNLLLVAFLGVLLRYKIAFYLPWVHQKFLLHGHSHFAFSGWVSQLLMTLIVLTLPVLRPEVIRKYRILLTAHQICAYGMLIGFLSQGYGPVSIAFSFLSILIAYLFGIRLWKDMPVSGNHQLSGRYFKAAIALNMISSIGTFVLASLIVRKVIDQELSLACLYYFLHFQYNGWFVFACIGLFTFLLEKHGYALNRGELYFKLFAWTIGPAYLLSVLWIKPPLFIWLLTGIAGLLQLFAWGSFLRETWSLRNKLKEFIPRFTRNLLLLSAVAMSLKFLLQAISTVPALSHYAFGFRPVVIAYLHLVFLGITTIFLMSYSQQLGILDNDRRTRTGIGLFVAGVLLNETLLMLQGFSFLDFLYLPYGNELLFSVAVIMLLGAAWIAISARGHIRIPESPSEEK